MAIAIVLAVVVLAVVLFANESIPIEVSALTVVCLLALTGVLTPEQAFAGFSNETVIFIFALLAMTQGLVSTGVVQLIGQRMAFFARFGHQTFVLAMMTAVGAFSSLVSNTVTTAAFLPVAIGAANRAKVPKSKVLLPLAYASMLGGTIFLYGTSTNLVVSEALRQRGMKGIGVAELAPLGLPIAIVGILLVVVLGPLLLPARKGKEGISEWSHREFITEACLTEGSRYLGRPLADISEGLGLRVIGLVRNGQSVPARPNHVLSREDRLLVEGKREDILRVKDLQGLEIRSDVRLQWEEREGRDLVMIEASVPPGSPLIGRSLGETKFADRYGMVVLALHRRPNIQRLTKLQLLGRIFGGNSLASLDINVGDVMLLRGPRDRAPALLANNMLMVLSDVEHEAPRYAKAALALLIFLTVLVLGSLNWVPLSVAGLVGMLLMIATRCVDARLAFRVDWRVVLLIGSMLSLGLAMEASGAGMFLGQKVALLASSGIGGPRTVMLALMVLTIVLSAPMSNQAAALVVLPVAINAATQLGVDPRAFAMAITLAASCSFITPLEPSCVMVYGPGHYRFTDFFRLGTPLTAVLVALLMVGVPLVWPFDGPGAKPPQPPPASVSALQRAP